MKCIKLPANQFGTVAAEHANQMVVRRVSDDVAFANAHNGPWEYATRTEWKEAGRKYGLGLT